MGEPRWASRPETDLARAIFAPSEWISDFRTKNGVLLAEFAPNERPGACEKNRLGEAGESEGALPPAINPANWGFSAM